MRKLTENIGVGLAVCQVHVAKIVLAIILIAYALIIYLARYTEIGGFN